MDIKKYSDCESANFKKMMNACFSEDYRIPLTEDQLVELCENIKRSVIDCIVSLDLLYKDSKPIGFINYQVDSLQSDWCEKEGYGCIRELYISRNFRSRGYGKILLYHAEKNLKMLSVPYIYLTTDDTISFWLNVGYKDTGEVCNKNNGRILVKEV